MPTEEQERAAVAGADGRMRRMQPVTASQLRLALGGRLDGWDLSDEDTPRLRRLCRGCKREAWFAFPGGVVPGLLAFLASWACETCAEAEEQAAERVQAQSERVRRIEQAGIPAGLLAAVGWGEVLEKGAGANETQARRRAIEAAKIWAEDREPKRGLLLHGPAGSGKSFLAATAARERLEHSPIRWVSVAVLMAQLTAAFNDQDRREALKVLTGRGALVLDDVDKIGDSRAARAQVFAMLDRREHEQAPLIVTTNLRPSELERALGDPITSRLMGLCAVFSYPGPDRRLEIGEEAS